MILIPLFKFIIHKLYDFTLSLKKLILKNNEIKGLKSFYSSTITLSINSEVDTISNFVSVIWISYRPYIELSFYAIILFLFVVTIWGVYNNLYAFYKYLENKDFYYLWLYIISLLVIIPNIVIGWMMRFGIIWHNLTILFSNTHSLESAVSEYKNLDLKITIFLVLFSFIMNLMSIYLKKKKENIYSIWSIIGSIYLFFLLCFFIYLWKYGWDIFLLKVRNQMVLSAIIGFKFFISFLTVENKLFFNLEKLLTQKPTLNIKETFKNWNF